MPQDAQPEEKAAAAYAGSKAGEYLESIGVFDLSELTEEQWQTFCEVMCLNYVSKKLEKYQQNR